MVITPLIPLTDTLNTFSPLVVESRNTSFRGSVAVAPVAFAAVEDRPLPSVNSASVFVAPTPRRLLSPEKKSVSSTTEPVASRAYRPTCMLEAFCVSVTPRAP